MTISYSSFVAPLKMTRLEFWNFQPHFVKCTQHFFGEYIPLFGRFVGRGIYKYDIYANGINSYKYVTNPRSFNQDSYFTAAFPYVMFYK